MPNKRKTNSPAAERSSRRKSAKNSSNSNSSNVRTSPRTPKKTKVNGPKKNVRKKAKAKSHVVEVGIPGRKSIFMSLKLIREIKQVQLSTSFLIPRAPFIRLVQEIIMERTRGEGMRLGNQASHALQEAAEHYIVQYLSWSYLCSFHARRVTLRSNDLALVKRLKEE